MVWIRGEAELMRFSFPTTLNGQVDEQMWLLTVTTEEDNYMPEKLINET